MSNQYNNSTFTVVNEATPGMLSSGGGLVFITHVLGRPMAHSEERKILPHLHSW